jgi:hypothetical protein
VPSHFNWSLKHKQILSCCTPDPCPSKKERRSSVEMINEEEECRERERKKKEKLLQLLFVLYVYNTEKLSCILWGA